MEMLDETRHLQQYIGFTTQDLEENHVGRMSIRQQKHLNRSNGRYNNALWFVFGLTLVGFLLMQSGLSPFCNLLFLGSLVFWAFDAWSEARQRGAEVAIGRVSMVEGIATLTDGGFDQDGGRIYHVDIGKHGFGSVTENLYQAFKPGQPYRVYYTPVQNQIVSAEILKAAD